MLLFCTRNKQNLHVSAGDFKHFVSHWHQTYTALKCKNTFYDIIAGKSRVVSQRIGNVQYAMTRLGSRSRKS